MEKYSSDDISRLITCKKTTIQPPKKEMKLERSSFRNEMKLESEDGKETFSVFMRKNQAFPENFSIGLRYFPSDGPSFTLYRCNGPHGLYAAVVDENQSHYDYHEHFAQADSVNEGNYDSMDACKTEEYASYEEALAFFIRKVGIIDADAYFSPRNLLLPNINGEDDESWNT